MSLTLLIKSNLCHVLLLKGHMTTEHMKYVSWSGDLVINNQYYYTQVYSHCFYSKSSGEKPISAAENTESCWTTSTLCWFPSVFCNVLALLHQVLNTVQKFLWIWNWFSIRTGSWSLAWAQLQWLVDEQQTQTAAALQPAGCVDCSSTVSI